ncbi:hypothetical protein ACFYY8_20375 [Streptosporangium sp. NPDC001559]|uniref:hypothetical protein n=1 Tax=Streptosporangium sp. NPDC001559 TaxID=3366187 RepID=UPI0036F09B06
MTPRRRTSTSTLLAGWLFADLLLGVTIIMLGAQSPAAPSQAAAETRPTAGTQAPADTRASAASQSAGKPETAGPQDTGPQSTGSQDNETPQATTEPQPTTESQPSTGAPSFTGAPSSSAPRPSEGASPTATGTARPLRDTVRALPTPSPTPDRPSPDATAPTTKPRSPRKPTPSPCVSRLGDVQAKPITISFQLSPGMGDEALAVQVRQELLRHRDQLAGRHAGMVLTFGADGGADNGVRLATRVNTAIRETYPRIFGAAVTRNFHDLAAPPGSISMEIYLMTYSCSPVSGS